MKVTSIRPLDADSRHDFSCLTASTPFTAATFSTRVPVVFDASSPRTCASMMGFEFLC
jgi:hypothetical protein